MQASPRHLCPLPRSALVGTGQPADYQDDELELADDYDPELDLLDDLCDRDED